MRIVAGTLGGRRLKSPAGHRVRPTSDKVREALFSILGDRISGARVLDLYAGTGAVGLEALSRGAESVLFVEQSALVRRILKENVHSLGLEDRCAVRAGRVPGVLDSLAAAGAEFDMVFADPPYERGQVARLLSSEPLLKVTAADALLIVEMRKSEAPDPGLWVEAQRRRYGDTCLWFLTRTGEEA